MTTLRVGPRTLAVSLKVEEKDRIASRV